MTSVPHLFCTLHNHNRTHIAATHSTFLSEYPSIALHRAGLWCYYTPLLVVYVLTPVAWLYVMPRELNGVVNEWKEKSPCNDTFVPFNIWERVMPMQWKGKLLFVSALIGFRGNSDETCTPVVYRKSSQWSSTNIKYDFVLTSWRSAGRGSRCSGRLKYREI